jgi:protein-S-isoprenylcysteine O-methyltransferase Ste14
MSVEKVSTGARPAPVFLLPPPLYFGAAFAVSILLQWLVPLGFGDFPGRFAIGVGLLAIGVIGGPLLGANFITRRTTLNPFGSPSSLVTGGPYRLSRNPMYVDLTIAYLGGILLSSSLWPIPLLLIPLGILDRVVVPFEEASMRRTFGAAYDAYCARVRRWL